MNEALALAASLEAFCKRVSTGLATATFDQKRQLVELLIDRVVVAGDEIEIRYVLPTSPQSEHIRFLSFAFRLFPPSSGSAAAPTPRRP